MFLQMKAVENKGPISFMSDQCRQSTESAPNALPEKRQTLSPTIVRIYPYPFEIYYLLSP